MDFLVKNLVARGNPREVLTIRGKYLRQPAYHQRCRRHCAVRRKSQRQPAEELVNQFHPATNPCYRDEDNPDICDCSRIIVRPLVRRASEAD